MEDIPQYKTNGKTYLLYYYLYYYPGCWLPSPLIQTNSLGQSDKAIRQ